MDAMNKPRYLCLSPREIARLRQGSNYTVLRKYIQEAGRRDSVLLLFQKEKMG